LAAAGGVLTPVHRSSTWSRTHVFTPRDICTPRSLNELLAIVQNIGRAGRTIKPAGALHSWSACAVTDDVSLQVGQLDRVLATDVAARTIRAEAGVRMRDLYTHMEQAGLALPCLPNVDAIQLGGAIANATHGTCIQSGSMCSLVDEIELVVFRPGRVGRADGRSELMRLKRSTTDPAERHLFEAAVASIGSLGVIYAVTLRCVPPYHSYVHERALPFDALRHRFAEMARQYYSLRLMWFPLADIVFTKIQVPIHGPVVLARSRSTVTPIDAFTIKLVAFANERNPRRWRRLRRMVGGLVANQFHQSREKLLATHRKEMLCTWYDAEIDSRLHAAFTTNPFVNLEYAVPLDRIDEVIEELRTLLPNYPLQAMSAVALRPVGADDLGYLAPPKGQAVMYVDVPYVADLERTNLYLEIERVLLRFGGRCSWSRLIYAQPRDFLQNYPEHPRFVDAKHQLDPANVFSNAFSDAICVADVGV
jgi:L-gulono-1,4-lactone dehydrogenase